MSQNDKIEITRRKIIDKSVYIVLIIALISLAWWGVYQYQQNKLLKTKLENTYNRAFHDLVDYVDDIQTSLDKGMLVSSPSQMASLSSDIFRKATSAKACLGQLPVFDVAIDNTAKFLSQVGDFTYMLSQNMINNEQVTEEEYQNLKSLSEYASKLNTSLAQMQNDVYSNNLSFGKIAFDSKKYLDNSVQAESNSILTNLENVEKEFQEYPSLIYDGPFSEHIENMQPTMLENAAEISPEEAKNKAVEFLGERGANIELTGESQNTPIDSYSFYSDKDDKQICINITKKGGYVLYFLDNRTVYEENLNFEQATQKAQAFLQEKGFADLKNSYYEKGNGVATINFAYLQNGVTCYSDLVKVQVALDNGEILGMECHGYLMNHKVREFPANIISESEAKSKISHHLSIQNVNMALIPKDSLKEIYCYEFHGQFDNKNFIIYINAVNGREEKILMLIESENGILTI